jgi:hypothetical protein
MDALNSAGITAPSESDRGHNAPSTEELLARGGDARIMIQGEGLLNKYGCSVRPDPEVAAFGSSTASTISESGFSAADALRRRLIGASAHEPVLHVYTREMERIRCELAHLWGLSDLAGLEIILAASGTDVHMITTQLAGSRTDSPLLVIMVEATETGSGVAAALGGRHFSTRTARDRFVVEGEPIAGSRLAEVRVVPTRSADGHARPVEVVDGEVEKLATAAIAAGRHVLLTMVDVSKTGLLSPSPSSSLRLLRRAPHAVDVLVDACQGRLTPATLRAYLEHGFVVAVTGSKFMTGPSFSGALLVPESVAGRYRYHAVAPGLSAYSSSADWPAGFAAARSLDGRANCGLLLRWEAALVEFRSFRSIPDADVASLLKRFADAVQQRLSADPVFEPVPLPALERAPLGSSGGWDQVPTIFPFMLRRPRPRGGFVHFTREATDHVYRALPRDTAGRMALGITGRTHRRCQLGQPVPCGVRGGAPVSALRLCTSARLVVEAAQHGSHVVIDRALAVLDETARIARSLRGV